MLSNVRTVCPTHFGAGDLAVLASRRRFHSVVPNLDWHTTDSGRLHMTGQQRLQGLVHEEAGEEMREWPSTIENSQTMRIRHADPPHLAPARLL